MVAKYIYMLHKPLLISSLVIYIEWKILESHPREKGRREKIGRKEKSLKIKEIVR